MILPIGITCGMMENLKREIIGQTGKRNYTTRISNRWTLQCNGLLPYRDLK